MKLRYSDAALRQLTALTESDQRRILSKMDFWRKQKKPLAFAKPLSGYDAYWFRVGKYRVICEVQADILFVIAIAKRDDAYKDL